MKSPCRCCQTPTSAMSMRFDRNFGAVCQECFTFIDYAEKRLRRCGIEKVDPEPVRFKPEEQKP